MIMCPVCHKPTATNGSGPLTTTPTLNPYGGWCRCGGVPALIAENERLRLDCENHQRIRDYHVEQYRIAHMESAWYRQENDRLKRLCHSCYQAYTHNDAEDNDCTELWMQGAAVDGELRERPNA